MSRRNRARIGFRGRLARSLTGRQPSGPTSTLLNGLVAYWKLDEASGSRADSGPNGATLADNATVTQGAGKQGNAAQFTNANSEFLSSASAAINPPATDSYTFSCWVNLDSIAAARTVFSRYGGASDRAFLLHFNAPDGKFYFYGHNTVPTQQAVASSVANTIGAWYHIVCYRDYPNGTVGIIINDGPAATASLSNAAPNQSSTTTFRLGQFNAGSFMDGRIDEMGFWSRLLTPAEITALYAGGAGVTHPAF